MGPQYIAKELERRELKIPHDAALFGAAAPAVERVLVHPGPITLISSASFSASSRSSGVYAFPIYTQKSRSLYLLNKANGFPRDVL